MFGDVAFAQAPFASLGGATYLVAVEEAANGVATPNVSSLVRGGPIDEAAAAAATQAVLASLRGTASETATGTNTQDTIAEMSATASETASGTDSYAPTAEMGAMVSETASGTDAYIPASEFYAAIAELASGTDVNYVVKGQYALIQEGAVADDSALYVRVVWSAKVSEAASALAEWSVIKSIVAYPTGVQLFVRIGNTLIWATIDDSQNANWQNITTTQSSGWAAIDDTQSPGWTNIPS